jgi:hypothetical protein
MTLLAAVGQAQALDGREAGLRATHQALNQLGTTSPTLAFVIASHQYDPQQVINGISGLLGNTPLVGFSSPAGLTSQGLHLHSVVVALLAASDARANVHWLPGTSQGSRETIQKLTESFSINPNETRLLFADGFNTDMEQLCSSLPANINLAGGLSSGDPHTGHAFQIGGSQSGASGLALTHLEGKILTGIGYAHGWQAVGSRFRITRSRGFWLRTLEGRPASETYAHLFGYPARDWAYPPLNHLARVYPLGIEQAEEELQVRSLIRVEADGSFRLNANVQDGSAAYLLVGSLDSCEQAVKKATGQALLSLNGAKPALALVLTDNAWQMLYEAQPGGEITILQKELGANVPIAGGYTLGQIVPRVHSTPRFLNQHMLVILFAEPQ